MDTKLSEQFYRIQTLDRALQIPSVNYLWDKSTKVYGRVKGANTFVNWAFGTVESVVGIVIEKSLPVARLIEKPICSLDRTLCQGLDFVEVNLPIIKEEPKQILDRTKSIVSQRLRPAVQPFINFKYETKQRVKIIKLRTYCKVHYLRVYSWRQADKVMSTETGMNILKTVDHTTKLAELMLDKYLPAPREYSRVKNIDDECSECAKLHHTIVKVTNFSNRAFRRIYCYIVEKFQHMYKLEVVIFLIQTLILIQIARAVESILTFVFRGISYCLFLCWYVTCVSNYDIPTLRFMPFF